MGTNLKNLRKNTNEGFCKELPCSVSTMYQGRNNLKKVSQCKFLAQKHGKRSQSSLVYNRLLKKIQLKLRFFGFFAEFLFSC